MKQFPIFHQQHVALIEKEMLTFIQTYAANENLTEAMSYSILAGGKRVRPLLILAVLASFGKDIQSKDYQVAASLEMIHTYSLIHDDLPAMDDDDLRRGQPTNHKIFGEAQAILAGDGLLTAAFELLAVSQVGVTEKVLLIQLLAKASGIQGMVAGQAGDLQGQKKQLTLAELVHVHEKKTGALMECALLSGGILAQQPEEILFLLEEFAHHLGLAFQIRDDLLDATSTKEELGKHVRRDAYLNKSTYPALLGIEKTKVALTQQIQQGKECLQQIHEISETFQPILLTEMIERLALN